jgi:uncharacterized protein (UPF0332 family)
MNVTLSDWEKNGWVARHKTSSREIQDLFRIADRDLADCKTRSISADWRLNIAYNAGLQMAKAALAACGYRASREAHHYRVVQSLALTVGLGEDLIRQFNQFRKKRNISDYETAGMVSDQEVTAMIELATALRKKIREWFSVQHPKLFSE